MNETSRDYLNRLDRRVRGMLLMIHELMTLAKSQSSQPQTEYKPVNLKSLPVASSKTFRRIG